MKTKRILSIALTLVMLLGMLPGMNLTAYAANNLTIYIMDMLENMDDNEWGYQLYDGDVSIAEGTYVQINMGTWHTGVMNIYMNGEVVYTKPSGSLYKDDVYHFTAGPNCKILGGYQNMFDWDGNPNVYITQDASVAVTGVTLNPNTAQTIDVGGSVAFTATVEPAGASDKTVKWSVGGTNADAVKLYSDSACTTEVGADATDKLTVYAKGESAGSATVTATSNADSTKSASCDVTVNAAQTQTEELLTTITAVGASNASTATSANVSYSTEDIATLTFSQVTPDGYGRVSYEPTWGWWGYGITLTVTPADGYTITKCVFYDDANRTATDSEAPFVVETAEEGDKAPKVNGTPILAYTSKGIKKIEVYGYAAPETPSGYTITIPSTLAVANSGWNATDGISATGTLASGKKLTVTASSANSWALKSGDNSVGYTLTTAEGGSQTTSWEFTTLDGTAKPMGIIVENYDNKPAGTYTDTVTFTAAVENAGIPVSSVTINNAPTEALFVNSTGTLTATVLPDDATDKTVTWSSDNPNHVKIDAATGEYTVTGVDGYGSATITATATNGTVDTSDDVTATCTITGKVTYTSLSVGTVLHTGDTFYTGGSVYFNTRPLMSFIADNGVITVVEATSGSRKCYKFQRGNNGSMPNVTDYKVKDNTDGVYITGGSGTNSDKFTLAVHTTN